ncbi:hypothetical protein H310_09587 [Aphanomyces invadans]|uniref:Uncharacterized protein n=1 Tax=Aphanomyces invadans TaxID=157072 RepID=A0A024TWF7_9STRA|nr:hypothetical protein H310_09587 [Aphanomyces invadans]ETV97702.1 hypothetical protein H310_09587 [Aphanomyces invadans]|eukprot:XP_008873911.1 hypothetical protein H310_09587 [Aphanomyces invadans]
MTDLNLPYSESSSSSVKNTGAATPVPADKSAVFLRNCSISSVSVNPVGFCGALSSAFWNKDFFAFPFLANASSVDSVDRCRLHPDTERRTDLRLRCIMAID